MLGSRPPQPTIKENRDILSRARGGPGGEEEEEEEELDCDDMEKDEYEEKDQG